jgi:drug/metabolite transporter (DMT)-like permease
LLLVHANRAAEASVIAPLIYSQIIIATIFGFLFFGEWPDSVALLGLAVIISAGAGSIWAAGRAR